MSVQDDVAVLVRAVGKGATVEDRVAALVGKVRGLLQGMRMNVTDPDVRGMLDEAAAALGRHSEAIVMAVVGGVRSGSTEMQFPAQPLEPPKPMPVPIPPQPEPEEDNGEDDEPAPVEPYEEPVTRHAPKRKPVAKRARR